MGAMLVLKMGSTLTSLKSRKGDFESWITAGLGLPPTEVDVVDVSADEPLPPADGHAGIIVTGSHTMVTERRGWSERAADWLRGNMRRDVPILGICYGHQLLAHALGGEVGNNPKGREFGTAEVTMEKSARGDALLGSLPRSVRVQVSHTQSILKLPPEAVRLASNPWDHNQAARFAPRAWGVQFHPEFDAEVIREYIQHFERSLREEGQDTDRLRMLAEDTPFGGLILRRFAGLCQAG